MLRQEPVDYIVRDLQMDVNEGEMIGIFGDSGSGKTLSMLALIGLHPAGLNVEKDISYFIDEDEFRLTGRGKQELFRRIRSKEIAFVFQQAASCLNPLLKVRKQLYECIDRKSPEKPFEICSRYLLLLGFEDPKRMLDAYPHELSVGQQQRIMLAQALVRNPRLIIADEPFAGLDMLTASNVRQLLKKINRETGVAMVVVSHDLKVLSGLADRYIEIKEKKAVSVGADELYERVGKIEFEKSKLNKQPKEQVMQVVGVGHSYRLRGSSPFSKKRSNHVLKDISFDLKKGEILGIMGMSGSGKSTLGRLIAGLEIPKEGEITINGKKIRLRQYNGWMSKDAAPVQMVFQDPFSSFNPAKTIAEQMPKASYTELMRKLNLDTELMYRNPGDLSGGQLQRMSLARALVLEPEILVLDESFSAIDMRSRDMILQFISGIRHNISMILISHLPDVIFTVCDRLIVLKSGFNVASGDIPSFKERNMESWLAKILGFGNEVT
jgi:peptide/nickel transport system ATP-binding protein